MASDREESVVLYHWSARTLQPVIVFYVTVIFVIFIAAAYFLFHSTKAVSALVLAAIGFIIPLFPGLIGKVEYQLTESGLEKRPLYSKKQLEYKSVFRWDELSHVIPMKHGFKFYKRINDSGFFRRIWRVYLSDKFSGEFHIEKGDLEKILSVLSRREIPTSKP